MAQSSRTIRDGLVVGIIAYLCVAAFYAAFDVLAARGALYTVDLLGKSVFRGLRDTAVLGLPVQHDTAAILWYNAFHLLMSLAIGLIVTGLVALAGFVVTIIAVGMLTRPIRPLLPWWSIVVANAFAVFLAGAYLLRRRPGIWHRPSPLSE